MTLLRPHHRLLSLTLTSLLAASLLGGCSSLPETNMGGGASGKRGPVLKYSLTELREIDLTANLNHSDASDIWERLTQGYQLDQGVNPRIQREISFYASRPRTLPAIFERARPYLFMIVEEIDKRGIPQEIALLPVIESAFHPKALSSMNAAGMWQFTPDTAQVRGIKNNWWFDGRRDVYVSTMAALDYLQSLHQRFDGDWLHALAAYNSGAITVRKAMEKNKARGKSTDYWALELPGETMRYVPKLLAVAQMIKQPQQYSLALPDIPNTPYLTRIEVDQQLDLATAAQMAGMDWEEFHRFNAGHKRIATEPGDTSHVLVPVDRLRTFAVNLARFAPQTQGNWIEHTVSVGDTLAELADRYDTTPALIAQVNQLNKAPSPGQKLLIPAGMDELDSETENQAVAALETTLSLESKEQQNKRAIAERKQNKKTSPASVPQLTHTLAAGQTLSWVSRRYGVSLKALVESNGITNSSVLRAGQTLQIPVKKVLTATAKKGDTWQKIAKAHGVPADVLATFNQSSIKSDPKPGQAIKVPQMG